MADYHKVPGHLGIRIVINGAGVMWQLEGRMEVNRGVYEKWEERCEASTFCCTQDIGAGKCGECKSRRDSGDECR